jgi:3-oxoacyl-[acyl-carrier-protein] synthase II
MKAYIHSAAAISPQLTFQSESLPEVLLPPQNEFLKCQDPDYKAYINPALIRRMSRVVKMGVAAAMKTMQDAGVDNPDAIITGTGLGCVEDTENFLNSIAEHNEQFLTPTPFIQSTHNTIGAQIALLIKCNSYNFAYVHRGFSFESALADALMHIAENQDANILLGGIDEITPVSFDIMKRLGMYSCTESSVAGEGASFFLLSGEKKNSVASVSFPAMITDPGNEIAHSVSDFLNARGLTADDVDLLLTGTSVIPEQDVFVRSIGDAFFKRKPQAYYKRISGDYMTASAFGLWLAYRMIRDANVPDYSLVNGLKSEQIRKVLVYSNYHGANHTLMLIEKC